jgi:hypothetical protein
MATTPFTGAHFQPTELGSSALTGHSTEVAEIFRLTNIKAFWINTADSPLPSGLGAGAPNPGRVPMQTDSVGRNQQLHANARRGQ